MRIVVGWIFDLIMCFVGVEETDADAWDTGKKGEGFSLRTGFCKVCGSTLVPHKDGYPNHFTCTGNREHDIWTDCF